MDPAPVMRHAQAYGPQADGHSTYPMEAQSIPQPFPGSLGAQGMEYQGYSGVDGAQGWPQRVLGEMKDMLLLLNADGRVTYASSSCKSITGYTAKQLEGKMFSNFTHKDDRAIVSYELDHCVTTGCALRLHLRFNRMSDSFRVLEAYGHPHMSGEGGSSGNTKRCDGVFLVCQPYSSRGSQLLDSFLEHKVENIRLMQQIAKLKEEEEEETNPSRQSYPKTENLNSKSLYNPHRRFASSHATGFPGPSVPDMTTSAEEYESSDTVANFDEASPTSFAEALSHIEGIEIMTGLYYGDGERSQGISTGTRRGRLIQCDTDATVVDQQSRNTEEGDRRKRLKGEHQCADCGTSDSPEWRKGPNGPKTLCNACGLRWAKKKRQLPS